MKSYYGEPLGTHQRSFERYHPRLLTASSFPRLGSTTPPKTPIAIISGMGEATDFKFGQNIHRVYPNKSPLKFRRKPSLRTWAYPSGTVQIFGIPPIISGMGKATNFKFCTNIHSINRKTSPLKILGKVAAVGIVRHS